MSAPELRTFVIPQDLAGTRLDVALARLSPDLTRSRVQRLVAGGNVRLAGRPAKASARLRGGEPVEVRLEPPEPTGALPQELPLAVLYQDAQLVVLDKAAGMVVHPARGTPHSTVVNALLHHLAEGASLPRVGLVHRLDKDTSGCIVVAR
ncbi:MAG TPA: RluA family pseudouridine synthase, partial [Anaeromyxobacter sp.]